MKNTRYVIQNKFGYFLLSHPFESYGARGDHRIAVEWCNQPGWFGDKDQAEKLAQKLDAEIAFWLPA